MRRLVPALLLAAACNADFDPQYRVLDLRILAVRSQVEGSASADAAPGETLRLEALVANPLGRTPLEVRWFACAPAEAGRLPPCLDPDILRDPAALAAHPAVLEIGQGEQMTIGVPDVGAALDALIDLALRTPTYQCSLYAELPVVVVAQAGTEREVAVKRVRLVPPPGTLPPPLQDGYLLNLNPAVGAVERAPLDGDLCTGGTPIASDPFPAGRTLLCGRPASGAVGPYNECDPDGNRTPVEELLFWQWYVTDGEFPEFDGLGNAVGASVEFERPAGPFTLWTILRDGRGGVAWTRTELPAIP